MLQNKELFVQVIRELEVYFIHNNPIFPIKLIYRLIFINN